MIRTGEQYLASIRDGREVYVNGERVQDVPSHPMFKPLVDIRVRMYDMQHDETTREVMTVEQDGEVNDEWLADDRRRLLAFARDMLNSDYAGHRLTFQLFAQSPPFAHLAAVYRNFDWDGPLDFVKNSAGLSERVLGKTQRESGDGAVKQWFATNQPDRKAAE